MAHGFHIPYQHRLRSTSEPVSDSTSESPSSRSPEQHSPWQPHHMGQQAPIFRPPFPPILSDGPIRPSTPANYSLFRGQHLPSPGSFQGYHQQPGHYQQHHEQHHHQQFPLNGFAHQTANSHSGHYTQHGQPDSYHQHGEFSHHGHSHQPSQQPHHQSTHCHHAGQPSQLGHFNQPEFWDHPGQYALPGLYNQPATAGYAHHQPLPGQYLLPSFTPSTQHPAIHPYSGPVAGHAPAAPLPPMALWPPGSGYRSIPTQAEKPEKPFSCPHCPARFARGHDRKRHERTHSDEKPYMCDCCHSRFSRTDALKRHVQNNCKKIKARQRRSSGGGGGGGGTGHSCSSFSGSAACA